MNEVKSAAFKLEKFKICEFSFREPQNKDGKINIAFEPSGNLAADGIYSLAFNFKATIDSNGLIDAKMIATFIFSEGISIEEIPGYFYKNAIAIVFPYLRAFISTLTLQAESFHVLLPLYNLSDLGESLKANTTTD